jgi:hypothetical protein
MKDQNQQQSIEDDIRGLRQSLDKYAAEGVHTIPELVPDLSNAIHKIGGHLVALHRRLERLEETEPEWTTRGWKPPPGADRSPGGAS